MAEGQNNDVNMGSERPEDAVINTAPAPSAPENASPAPPTEPVKVIPAKPFLAKPPEEAPRPKVPAVDTPAHHWAKYAHILVHILLLVVIVVLAVQLNKSRSENQNLTNQITTLKANPLLVAERKTNETIAAVSRLTTVPQGDTPTVTEVTDANAVKKSITGLNDVQNGDKLLFYVKAARFIQYRPSTDKILIDQPLHVK